ncbi:MAG: leucine-rich repeat domain-containing protein [Bacteroidota bacterium]
MSELARRLIREAKETGATKLDLGKCGLTDWPKELFELTELEELSLANKTWNWTKRKWVESPNKGLNNFISHLPPELSNLSNLTSLNVGGGGANWLIKDIGVLETLTSIQLLDLRSNNQIKDYSVLETLTGLQSLSLSYNQISDISVLETLTGLQSLDLSVNQIRDISVLETLTGLQLLDLSSNPIRDISVLETLTDLQSLYLSYNKKIKDFSVLETLTGLQLLDLRSNPIRDISVLETLTSLQFLDLSYSNHIKDFSILETLTGLQSLDLRDNQISDIRPLLPLIKKNIRVSLKKYDTHQTINLHNNPLQIPPVEIVEKGTEAILNYFEELATSEFDSLYETKVLLVGEGGVGKTSLGRRLKNRKAILPDPDDRTRGIAISKLNFPYQDKEFRLNIWDFGGQDIYHATHRFFLTRRSLYILMTETRRQDDNFDYWIPNIRLFGGKSPILVVKNLFKGHQRHFPIGRFRKSEEFNIPENILDINLLNNEGLDHLEKVIYHHAVCLPHVGEKVPKTWVKVRDRLESEAKDHAYISLDKYLIICQQEQIKMMKLPLHLVIICMIWGSYFGIERYPD